MVFDENMNTPGFDETPRAERQTFYLALHKEKAGKVLRNSVDLTLGGFRHIKDNLTTCLAEPQLLELAGKKAFDEATRDLGLTLQRRQL